MSQGDQKRPFPDNETSDELQTTGEGTSAELLHAERGEYNDETARLCDTSMENVKDIMDSIDESKKYLLDLHRSMDTLAGFEHVTQRPLTRVLKPYCESFEEHCSSDSELCTCVSLRNCVNFARSSSCIEIERN